MKKNFMKDKEVNRIVQERNRCLEELKQLENETHPSFIDSVHTIQGLLNSELAKLKNICQFKIDEINEEHEAELKLLDKEAKDYYKDIVETSINELETKKKVLENEKNTIDINSSNGGDILEVKPLNTRKLRRRVQDNSLNDSAALNGHSISSTGLLSSGHPSILIGSQLLSNLAPDVSSMLGVGQGLGPMAVSVTGSTQGPGIPGLLGTPGDGLEGCNDPFPGEMGVGGRKRRNTAGASLGVGTSVAGPQGGGQVGAIIDGPGGAVGAQLSTILPESAIHSDLMKIQRLCGSGGPSMGSNSMGSTNTVSTVGSKRHSSSGTGHTALHVINGTGADSVPQAWVDDGRLFIGNKCISQNMNVTVDSRDSSINKVVGTVVCIGVQDIALRRLSDNGMFRISLQHIRNGKTTLNPCTKRL